MCFRNFDRKKILWYVTRKRFRIMESTWSSRTLYLNWNFFTKWKEEWWIYDEIIKSAIACQLSDGWKDALDNTFVIKQEHSIIFIIGEPKISERAVKKNYSRVRIKWYCNAEVKWLQNYYSLLFHCKTKPSLAAQQLRGAEEFGI